MGQIMEIMAAWNNPGQHVVLFGERGVGKTSLANVLTEIFSNVDQTRIRYGRVNCTTDEKFTPLWRRVFRELNIDTYDEESLVLRPDDIRRVLAAAPISLIVLDELDRVDDDETLTLLADTVKALSDHAVRSTLVLVGVADSVEALIGDHLSIERALVQVAMPRMPEQELREIVDKGLKELDMSVEPGANARIARLSEGLPHYTHLLAQHATLRAVQDDRSVVSDADVDGAIRAALDKAQHSVKSSYQRAVRSVRTDAQYEEVLLACALAKKDEFGFFAAGKVRQPLSTIMGRSVQIPAFARHLAAFTEGERDSVLTRVTVGKSKFYRFSNPMLQPYVVMQGVARGLVSEAQLRADPDLGG